MEKHGLQFNYHDGHIDTSVCAEPGDSQASLNIKRAIISLFQSAVIQDNGVTTHRETDIFGSCQTDFEFTKDGDNLIIRKQRNLGSCSRRENMRHALVYAVYDDSSDIKSSPVLDSQYKIEQVLKGGILNSAKSTETYSYKPFANGNAGAKTVVDSSLILKSSKADAAPAAPVSLPKSLIFDAPHPVVDSSAESIVAALKTVKDVSGSGAIKDSAAEKFGELVKILRRSNKNDILKVYDQVKSGASGFDKNTDKKILLDALYRTGSGEAAEVIVDLIKNAEVTGLQALAYYASLALVDHVNLPAVTSVTTLLDQPNLPRIGYLGIGRVIGKYCQDHSCENTAEVKTAVGKLVAKIANGKPGNREQENLIIAALKAIRNSKYLDDQNIEKIVAVAKDKTVHDRVRVAALEALTAKCSPKWKKPIIAILGDKEEDSEVRIKAYLSLVECPCSVVASAVKEIIDVETINQVGSFVTSHLRNLRASTDPNKQDAKRHLGEIRSQKKFPEDFRKFSFNNEFSYNIDTLGLGSTVEQNVIYSQKSFVPRSVSLNLTNEIFGRSFNFLQVDARAENLDRLIEHYFGPKGVLKQQAITALLLNGKKGINDVYDHVKERVEKTSRGRRSAIKQADIDKFAKNVKTKESEVDDDVDIDLSIRMFGVELAYIDWKERGETSSANFHIDRIFDMIDRAFKKAKDFDYSVSNHLHFIDFELSYPTGLGFPLSVGVEGNGVTHIKANGKLDVPAIMRDPNNAVIKIALEPSASIAIVASLGIDTFGIESGLKIVSRLHTSTGSDLSVKVLDGKGIDINFGIPKRKQEIISISSQVYLTDNKGQTHEPKFAKGKEHSDCFDQFSTVLGVTVCGYFSYPYDSIESVHKTPMFPLSGPSKLAISIENNDAPSYHFRAYYDTSKPAESALEVIFDTPNSRTNRKIAARVSAANKPNEKYIKASLNSPLKNIEGQILLENNDKKKALTVSVNHDKDEYYASVGLVANGNKYKPILDYKIPDHIEKLASGKGSKGGPKAVYKAEGDITVVDQDGGKKYTFDKVALVASGKKLVSLDGFVTAKPDGLIIDGKVSHNEENLSVKLDGKRQEHGFDLNLIVVPSKDPNVGFKIVWHYDLSNNLVDHSFVLIHGADLESTVNRLTITDRVSYKKNDHPANPYEYFNSLKYKSEITYPAQELAGRLEAEISSNNVATDFAVKYGKFKTGAIFEIEVEAGSPQNWEFLVKAHLLENAVVVGAKSSKLSDHKRKFEGQLEIPGGKYEIETVTNYLVEVGNIEIQFNGNLKINSKNLNLDYGLEANPQKVNSHAVISLDKAKYLDFLLKIERGGSPHGNVNLNLKSILIITGQFNYQNGKGGANVVVDLPKLNRKIKGTGDITVTGPRHVANIEILLNAEKDPNKRIKISTDTDITKTSLDTKNVVKFFAYTIEANAKGNIKEQPEGGYQFDGNADVTLPNGRYIVTKGKHVVDHKADKTNLNGQYELIDHPKKGGESRKIAYNFDVGFVEPKRQEFNSKYTIKAVNFDGKDVQFVLGSGHTIAKDNSGKRTGQLQIAATGSYLPKPFAFNFDADYTNKKDINVPHEGSWKLESSLGNDLSVKGSGKYYDGHSVQKPRTANVDVALILPSEKLRNLKYQGSSSLVLPQGVDSEFDYKTSQSLTYNDDKTIKVDGHLHQNGFEPGQKKDGSAKITLAILAQPPLTIGGSFKHDPTAEIKHGSGTLNIKYGDKELTAQTDASYDLALNNIAVGIKATTPVEKFHSVDVGFAQKREQDGPWKYLAHIIADESKYELNSEFEINPSVHRANVVLVCPGGKTELLAKVNKLSDTEYKGWLLFFFLL